VAAHKPVTPAPMTMTSVSIKRKLSEEIKESETNDGHKVP
jgi:hypothetical protein